MLTRREKYLYIATMSYDEIDIEDMEWREEILAFTYQCPCGDLFQISMVNYR
jgi:diphthamide biosynthesis protein 3